MGPLSILIVEDEPLIAMMLEDFLEELGHSVADTADNVAGALDRAAAGGFDIAILDARLRDGEESWPVADFLADAGIPFLMATGGYIDSPPARHIEAPLLAKPFTMEGIRSALEAAHGRAGT